MKKLKTFLIIFLLLLVSINFSPSEIANEEPPIADAGGPYQGGVNEIITLSGSNSIGENLEYSWNFGDGQTSDWSTNPTITHQYDRESIYSVVLTVRNVYGQDSDLTTVKITETSSLDNLMFPSTGGPYRGYVNENITFDAWRTIGQVDILGYIWDFGDGHIDGCVESEIVHKYSNVGVYTVNLSVMTAYGSISNSTTVTISRRIETITNGTTWDKYLESGNWVLKSYAGLVNYKRDDVWYKIDPTMRNKIGYLVVDNAPYILEVFHDRTGYRMYPDRNNRDKWIDFYMPDIKVAVSCEFGGLKLKPFYNTQSSVKKNQLVWNFNNFAIKVIPTNSMVSFEYILKNELAPTNISMKIIPHNCIIAPNGFIDGGKYKLINLVYDEIQPGTIISTYNTETNMLNMEVNTTGLQYPITLDPTITVDSDNYGGYILGTGATWTISHEALAGTLVNYIVYSRVGWFINNIYRSYLYFDTSALDPSIASSFVSGNVSLYGESTNAGIPWNLILQHNLTNVHPEVPLLAADYNYKYYNNSSLGYFPALSFAVDTWNYIPLNTSALENITIDGETKYCVRSSYDINNTSVGGIRYIDFYNHLSLYPPVLTLVWNGPEITDEYPRDGQTGVPRYFDNFTVQVNDSTGKKMNIYWYIKLLGVWYSFANNLTVLNGTYRQGSGVGGFLDCWNFTWEWSVNVSNANGVWANETFSYRSINSSAPFFSNMIPQNRTVFGVDDAEISITVNDTDNQQINIELWFFYGNCSYRYFEKSTPGLGNQTFTVGFNPSSYPPGTIQWFARIQDISCDHVDNTVYSDVFWFTNLGTWSDNFCGRYAHPNPINLINHTNYTSYISPVRSQDSDHPILYDNPSFVEFREYMNNTVSGNMSAAQVQMATGTNEGQTAGPHVAFINDTVGYGVYIVFAGGNNRIYIRKTVDGGTTWNYATASSVVDNILYVGMWYDGWTSGNYGNKIHLALLLNNGANDNQILYGYYDIDTNTITIDYDNVIYTFRQTPTFLTDGRPSICVSTDGNIFLSAWGGATNYDHYEAHGIVMRSNDSGDTWTDITPSTEWLGISHGYFRYLNAAQIASCQLIPHGENNVSLIHHHFTSIVNWVYNSSNSSWGNFATVGSCFRFYVYPSATYWKKTGDIYVTWLTRQEDATADVVFKQYNLSNKTWWGERIIEDSVYGYDSTIAISEGNGDLYIHYGNSSTSSNAFMNISCVNSTDHGDTWGESTRLNSDPPGFADYTYGNLMSEHRIYGSWNDWGFDWWRGRSIREYNETHSYGFTGNLTSVRITLPSDEFRWCTFNANYSTHSDGVNFSIYNKTGGILFDNLDGNNNIISSINTSVEDNRTIYLVMHFSNTSKVDWWNITFVYLNTTVNIIIPWHVGTFPLIITANGSCTLDNVTLWYRFSTDNATWESNVSFVIDLLCPWEWNFNFTNGTGYYQFHSIGQSSCGGGVSENPPDTADTFCYFNWGDFVQDITDFMIYQPNMTPIILFCFMIIVSFFIFCHHEDNYKRCNICKIVSNKKRGKK